MFFQYLYMHFAIQTLQNEGFTLLHKLFSSNICITRIIIVHLCRDINHFYFN